MKLDDESVTEKLLMTDVHFCSLDGTCYTIPGTYEKDNWTSIEDYAAYLKMKYKELHYERFNLFIDLGYDSSTEGENNKNYVKGAFRTRARDGWVVRTREDIAKMIREGNYNDGLIEFEEISDEEKEEIEEQKDEDEFMRKAEDATRDEALLQFNPYYKK